MFVLQLRRALFETQQLWFVLKIFIDLKITTSFLQMDVGDEITDMQVYLPTGKPASIKSLIGNGVTVINFGSCT